MNLVNCYVTEIIGKPFKCKNTHCWGLEVKYDSYGNESTTKIFLDTKAEILKIKIGYEFLH
jgi:hypothetical protein